MTTGNSARTCFMCGDPDTRPYGPEGRAICFPCSETTPELQKERDARFRAFLDAAGEDVVLRKDGPPIAAKDSNDFAVAYIIIPTNEGES